MVKFGIRLLGTLGNVSHLQKLASMAEKSGFDACWFAHDPFQPNSWVSSVAVASVTKKISIGFNIKPYTIDPSEIATFAALLTTSNFTLFGGTLYLFYGSGRVA